MALKTARRQNPSRKSPASATNLLKNPKVAFALALIFADALLVSLIISYVPYTKIDWDAYMSQVTGFLEGERDYSNLKGDTGPLVYPAGFLYVYSAVQYITGGEVYPAQILFGILYIVNLGIILFIYVKTDVLPWWALILLSLSKRAHSIFVLRLFNDCFAMTLLHAAVASLLYQQWHLGLILFSGAVSIKMNVLLYAPPLLLLMLKAMDIRGVISALVGAALVQILLGLPFLVSYPVAYISRAFNLGRVFIHFWSVNFKFVPEPVFVSKQFAISLLIAHLGLLAAFAHYRWCNKIRVSSAVAEVRMDSYSYYWSVYGGGSGNAPPPQPLPPSTSRAARTDQSSNNRATIHHRQVSNEKLYRQFRRMMRHQSSSNQWQYRAFTAAGYTISPPPATPPSTDDDDTMA